MTIYKTISISNGKQLYEDALSGDWSDIESYVVPQGEGKLLPEAIFDSLAVELETLMSSIGSKAGNEFEGLASEIVHRSFRNVPATVIADRRFWVWLSFAKMRNVIEWRHGGEESSAAMANYGLGQPYDGLLLRLWLRGDIGYDDLDADAYKLSRLGDQDLWRSHIFRTRYGRVRELAKSLLRYHAQTDLRGKARTDMFREAAPRFKRLGANVYFELLTASECDGMVAEIAAQASEQIHPGSKRS